MKVLITGASGFIGSKTLHALYSQAIDLKTAGRSNVKGFPTEIVGQIDSTTEWGRALEGVDTVVHLAAYAHGRSDKTFYEVNFEGTKNLAQQAKKYGVKKLIYLGSIGSVRRASDIPLKESDTPEPETPYTKSKLLGEEAVRDFFPQQNTILRAPTVFGKGCKGNLRTLLGLKHFPLPICKDAVRALIDVETLANYLVRSVTKEPLGTVHVANPQELPLTEVADILGLNYIKSPRAIFSLLRGAPSLVPLYEPLRVSTELQARIFGDSPDLLTKLLKKWIREETS